MVAEETFIDICSEASRQGKSVSLLYNGSRYANATGSPRVCSCAISTSDCDSPGRLKFRAVDIRLHSYNNISLCNYRSRMTLTDTAYSHEVRCQRNYFQKGLFDLFYSTSPYARVSLYNQPGVHPSQVWLSVTGMCGIETKVLCKLYVLEVGWFIICLLYTVSETVGPHQQVFIWFSVLQCVLY